MPHAFTADGKALLLFNLQDTKLDLHDAQTGQPLLVFDQENSGELFPTFAPQQAAFTPDSQRLVVAVSSPAFLKLPDSIQVRPGVVQLWNFSAATATDAFSLGRGVYVKGLLTPGGNEALLLAHAPPGIEHWDLAARKRLTQAPFGAEERLSAAAVLSPDGEFFVVPQQMKVEGKGIAQPQFVIRRTRTGQEESRVRSRLPECPWRSRRTGRRLLS